MRFWYRVQLLPCFVRTGESEFKGFPLVDLFALIPVKVASACESYKWLGCCRMTTGLDAGSGSGIQARGVSDNA